VSEPPARGGSEDRGTARVHWKREKLKRKIRNHYCVGIILSKSPAVENCEERNHPGRRGKINRRWREKSQREKNSHLRRRYQPKQNIKSRRKREKFKTSKSQREEWRVRKGGTGHDMVRETFWPSFTGPFALLYGDQRSSLSTEKKGLE